MNAPQAVTERYVSNLIHYGRNKEFNIIKIIRQENMVSGDLVGFYYETVIDSKFVFNEIGRGATIAQAVRGALIKHGVTFR